MSRGNGLGPWSSLTHLRCILKEKHVQENSETRRLDSFLPGLLRRPSCSVLIHLQREIQKLYFEDSSHLRRKATTLSVSPTFSFHVDIEALGWELAIEHN